MVIFYNKSSGIALDPNVITKFEEMKLRKAYAFIVFKISSDSTIIETEAELVSSKAKAMGTEMVYEQLLSYLPTNEARYAVIDLEYQEGQLEGVRNRLVFIMWYY